MRAALSSALRRVEHGFDAAFGATLNPLRQLGALAFLMFWLLAVSGIYLYIVIDTSATGAYPSINSLSRQPWSPGAILRGVHRYAADAFVVLMLAHLLREWLFGRYRAFRRFSWLTGVPLLLFAMVSAVGGFWLNWDQLGQFSATASAELLDGLPLFSTPLARNFLADAAVTDRLFSLFVFIHLGAPLLLVFGLWFHIQRISRAVVFPPRALALGTCLTLLALALARPVLSHAPADLAVVPEVLTFDWLLLFMHPLMYATSAGTVWLLLTGALVGLVALPFWPQSAARVPVAVVDPANCNGCRRCFDDCPFAAVTMVPHPLRRSTRQMAQVNADLCASCGICVGACPSSTPFRSATHLVTGIDMPSAPIGALRQQLQQDLNALRTEPKIVIFGCDRGASVAALAAPDVATFSLMCTGMLPPSFVEYALRDGAAAVLVSGCREGGCEFRLGQRWTAQRLSGAREPHLRTSVPPNASRRSGPTRETNPHCTPRSPPCALVSRRWPAPRRDHRPARHSRRRGWDPTMSEHSRHTAPLHPKAWIAQGLLYALFAAFIGVFSSWPTYRHLASDQALIKLSFSHTGKPVSDCATQTPEQLAKLPPNMRAPLRCPRERSPIVVELDVDGAPALRHSAKPSGLSKDGASSVYHRLQVDAGTHRVAVRLRDDVRSTGFAHVHEQTVTLRPAQILVIDFDPATQLITLQ